MSEISHILNQIWVKIATTRNLRGDMVESSRQTFPCHFRYSTQLDRSNNGVEIASTDSMVWFEPDADISEGEIGKVDNKFWKIDKLIKARRFDSEIVFLKAYVTRYDYSALS